MAQCMIEPGDHIRHHCVAIGFVEEFVPRLRIQIQLQLAIAGISQSLSTSPEGIRTWHLQGRYPVACGVQNWTLRWPTQDALEHSARVWAATWVGLGGRMSGAVREGPWPDTATPTHNAESLQPNYSGWTQNGDFSSVFSLRTGAIPGAAVSSFAVLGTSGVSIRAGGNGNMFVVNSANNQGIWDSGVPYRALTQYRVGISRTGDRVAVAINDRGFEIAGLSLGGVLRIAGAANTTTPEFVGWLEKAIFWADGRPQARLLQLMETWL